MRSSRVPRSSAAAGELSRRLYRSYGVHADARSSIGGLLAARVLADHYDEVVVVDPDNDLLTQRAKTSLPKEPRENAGDVEAGRQPRTRVMQARMLHGSQGTRLKLVEDISLHFVLTERLLVQRSTSPRLISYSATSAPGSEHVGPCTLFRPPQLEPHSNLDCFQHCAFGRGLDDHGRPPHSPAD